MGDIYTWSTTPTDTATTLENHHIKIAMLQRLLEPIIRINNTEKPGTKCDVTCPKCNKTYKHQKQNDHMIEDPDEVEPSGHTLSDVEQEDGSTGLELGTILSGTHG